MASRKWVKFEKDGNKVQEMMDGENPKFLKKLGFSQCLVEESEKGGWWRKGTAPTYTDEETIENEYIADKQVRDIEMASLCVEVGGKKLQADEIAQNRMARAILVMEKKQQIQWITEDNQIVMVTREELEEALRKAVQEQTVIWTKPHINKHLKKNKHKSFTE